MSYHWNLLSVNLLLLYLFLFCGFASSSRHRELHTDVNPGCPPERCNTSVIEMVHIQAVGPNDTLHHLWGFQRQPSIVIALTAHDSNISVNWEKFPIGAKSVEFSSAPIYSFGLVLNELYIFDDVNNTGIMDLDISNDSYVQKLDMPDIWELKNKEITKESVNFIMIGNWSNSQSVKKGYLRIEVKALRSEAHSTVLPHLLHSANATLMDFMLIDMESTSDFKQGRYALEFVLAADESSGSRVVSNSFKNLDDEHTPGVFTLVNLETAASKDHGNGGYVQWRPVAYIAEERNIVNSTDMALYDVKNVTTPSSVCNGTLLMALFGASLENRLVRSIKISFGGKDDGFYAKNNFTSWTATIGYGSPPDEKFSLVVILVISICLGLPALLIVLSCIYVGVRRISHRKDDLFLSR